MRRTKDRQHHLDEADDGGDATHHAKHGHEHNTEEATTTPACPETAQAKPDDASSEDAAGANVNAEIRTLQDQLLRLGADFDNFRKRTLRDKTLVCETANNELMLQLLPVLDHLQLAVNAATEHKSDPAFREGLLLISDQLTAALTKFGLTPISAEGAPFDPNFHEAVNCLPSDEHPEGVVIAQSRRGYLLNNRLLRPTQVIVSSGPGGAATGLENSSNS